MYHGLPIYRTPHTLLRKYLNRTLLFVLATRMCCQHAVAQNVQLVLFLLFGKAKKRKREVYD